MARITVEDCLTKETNRFALVQLAAKRTKQLLHGAKVASTDKRENKAVVTALREIAGGKVRFMSEEEARLAAEREAEEAMQQGDAPAVDPLTAALAAAASAQPAPLLADDDDDEEEAEEEEGKGKGTKDGNNLNGDNSF